MVVAGFIPYSFYFVVDWLLVMFIAGTVFGRCVGLFGADGIGYGFRLIVVYVRIKWFVAGFSTYCIGKYMRHKYFKNRLPHPLVCRVIIYVVASLVFAEIFLKYRI